MDQGERDVILTKNRFRVGGSCNEGKGLESLYKGDIFYRRSLWASLNFPWDCAHFT